MSGATVDHISFAIAALAAAVGAAGVWWVRQQFQLSRQLAVTAFEDSLVEEYRSILKDLPVEALVSSTDTAVDTVTEHLIGFYRYFDLCNQQVFLRHQRPDPRITPEVWKDWREGIDAHMHRAAFKLAWKTIGDGTFADDPSLSFFNGFRALRSGRFGGDPAEWPPDWQQLLGGAPHGDEDRSAELI